MREWLADAEREAGECGKWINRLMAREEQFAALELENQRLTELVRELGGQS